MDEAEAVDVVVDKEKGVAMTQLNHPRRAQVTKNRRRNLRMKLTKVGRDERHIHPQNENIPIYTAATPRKIHRHPLPPVRIRPHSITPAEQEIQGVCGQLLE